MQEASYLNTFKAAMAKKGIYRDSGSRVLGGVCSGLSYYLGIDKVILRLIFIACVFFLFAAVPVYVILWAVMPKARTDKEKSEMRGEEGGGSQAWSETKAKTKRVYDAEIITEIKKKPASKKSPLLSGVLILFSSVLLCLCLGIAFSVPFLLELARDIEFGFVGGLILSLNGVFSNENAFSIGSIFLAGKIMIPLILLFIYGVKLSGKTEVNSSASNYLVVGWVVCLLGSYFFS